MGIGDLFDLVKPYGLWGIVAFVIACKGPSYIDAVGKFLNRRKQLNNEHRKNMERLKTNRRKKRKEK